MDDNSLSDDNNYHVDKLNPEGGSPGGTITPEKPKITDSSPGGTSDNKDATNGKKHLSLRFAQAADKTWVQRALSKTRAGLARFIEKDKQSVTENEPTQNKIDQQTVHYKGGQTAIEITGKQSDSIYDISDPKHKYGIGPTNLTGEAIVQTKSGDQYYLKSDTNGIHIIYTEKGKQVVRSLPYGTSLSPIQFGKNWTIDGIPPIEHVESVLLKYKVIPSEGSSLDNPNPPENPFAAYKKVLEDAAPDRQGDTAMQESVDTPSEYHISTNDEALVNGLLTTHPLYDVLVGEKDESERKPWDPEEQKQAQQGMAELIQTELTKLMPQGKTITINQARAYIHNLYLVDGNKDWVTYFKSKGIGLNYQELGTINLDVLQTTGDFLHFGDDIIPIDAPDLLPSGMRIYVVTKPSANGHVAAEVIRRAREKGYEPYGKVWDESTSTKPLHERKDRLLFYLHTQSQMDIIMDSLQEIQQEQPELFETEIPLLTEPTDIPGVGIADEPIKTEKSAYVSEKTFNSVRETIITAAWNQVLQEITGKNDEEGWDEYNRVDTRVASLINLLSQEDISMDQIITKLRQHVRSISPTYNVSPDNFARNTSST